MKILVTGGQGFVGRPLCDYLKENNYEVVAAVRSHANSEHELVIGDMHVETDWHEALTGCDAVIHLAARVHQMRDKSANPLTEFRRTNVECTVSLAQQAAKLGVRRFVFVSSIKVNGEGCDKAYQESDEAMPQDPYAISKWEAEQELLNIAHRTGMEVVIVRPPLVYGPGVKGNFATLIRLVRMGVPLPLGAVQNHRSLLALENLIDFLTLCADREHSPLALNHIFLLADCEGISTPKLLSKVASAYGLKAKLIPVPPVWLKLVGKITGKQQMVDRLLGSLSVDSTKARALLGWHPVISMDEQLRKMAVSNLR